MENLQYIVPNMHTDNDSQAIRDAISQAKKSGVDCVRIPKKHPFWDIDTAILLPSDITIYLDNCTLRLSDGVYDNIFRSENFYDQTTYTLEQEQKNIRIIGLGHAVLDGGNHNGLFETNAGKNGLPDMRKNNLILLQNVSDYVLENFRCTNMRWWAINQYYCRNGRLSNLSFFNNVYQPNQDGINLRLGCNQILIEKITGRTGDDTVALSAFGKSRDANFAVAGKDKDIHDITIQDVCASTCETIVALRACDGAQIYRVRIDNVRDAESEYIPWGVVRIGENNYYRERAAIMGEIRELSVSNVFSRGLGTIFLAAALQDSHIRDVYAAGDTMYAISTYFPIREDKKSGCANWGGVSLKNVVIENVFYSGKATHSELDWKYTYLDRPYDGCALDFRCLRETDTFENVIFRNIFPSNGRPQVLAAEGREYRIE